MKKYHFFLSENFLFLEVKFSTCFRNALIGCFVFFFFVVVVLFCFIFPGRL